MISLERYFEIHDVRLSKMHISCCLEKVETMNNYDLARVLRVALKTPEMDEVQGYLI